MIEGPLEADEPYVRNGHVYERRRRNVIHSPRLRAFDACVGHVTRGQRYRFGDPVLDELAVHQALTEASRDCARRIRGLL